MDDWIKMWYIYTMEYYSAIEKNEILPFGIVWMDLVPGIMLSDQVRWRKTNMWNLKYQNK